ARAVLPAAASAITSCRSRTSRCVRGKGGMSGTHRVYANDALDASGVPAAQFPNHATHRRNTVQLYFSPLACSLATRISFYEAGAAATFTEVDTKLQRTLDGTPYREINPLGLVPALRLDSGELLTENAAVLQFVADNYPEAQLAPRSGLPRTRLQQWLCF